MFRQFFALITGAILLVLGLMFSVALFAFIALAGIIALGYFWWKTRALRKVMTQQMGSPGSVDSGGAVFEGEAIIIEEPQSSTIELLPAEADIRFPK